MKKLLLTVLLSVFVMGSYAFAGMSGSGGGMMGDSSGDMMGGQGGQQMGSGMMGDQQGQMGQGGMMTHGDMMGGMHTNMNHMTGLMQKMTDVMSREMSASNMNKMSEIMRDMSLHMTGVSDIMSKDSVSQKEMQGVNDHIHQIEKRFDMMKFR